MSYYPGDGKEQGGYPPAYPGNQQQYPPSHQYHPPQASYPQPQNMAYPPQQGGYPVGQPTSTITINTQGLVGGGGCPSCRVGYLHDDYGCFAIFLAIFFFPIGILCCLAMKDRRCTNCKAVF